MTVKCLTKDQKDSLINFYVGKTYTQRELSKLYKTSERTVNRVLVEAGIATPVERIKGDAYLAMAVLAKYGVPVVDLETHIKLAKEEMARFYQHIEQEQLSEMLTEYEDVPY